MRTISALALSSLSGSQAGVRVIVDVWRGGKLLASDIPITSWKVDWDVSRQVHGQASIVVADSEGLLAPWGFDDTLGAGGSRLHLRYFMPQSNQEVSLGWFRIVTAATTEVWRLHPTALKTLLTGATIDITADELTWQVTAERFLSPESPKLITSVFAELGRILDGIVPLGSTAGITDIAVPAGIVYTVDRINAVYDLASSVSAYPRMSENGLLDLVPIAPAASVWTIAAADSADGVLIDLRRTQDASGLPNAAVVEGTAPDGSQIIGRATVIYGPLAFGGPHGRIPAFLASPIMDTQGKVDLAATSFQASSLAQRYTVVPVVCLPNPALQPWDTVSIVSFIGTMTGQIQTMGLSGTDNGILPMTLGVSVSSDQLANLAVLARRSHG